MIWNSGKFGWFRKETIAKVPSLYARDRKRAADFVWIEFCRNLSDQPVLPGGMSLAQWLGWLISIPLLVVAGMALRTSGECAPAATVQNPENCLCELVWDTPIGTPLKCTIAILIHAIFVYLLDLPLFVSRLLRSFPGSAPGGMLSRGLVSKLTDRGFERVVNRTRSQRQGGESILILYATTQLGLCW